MIEGRAPDEISTPKGEEFVAENPKGPHATKFPDARDEVDTTPIGLPQQAPISLEDLITAFPAVERDPSEGILVNPLDEPRPGSKTEFPAESGVDPSTVVLSENHREQLPKFADGRKRLEERLRDVTDPGLQEFVRKLDSEIPDAVTNVNVKVLKSRKEQLAEIDVVTKKAVIEFKSGGGDVGEDLVNAVRRKERVVDRPVVIFGEKLHPAAVEEAREAGVKVFTNLEDLKGFLK